MFHTFQTTPSTANQAASKNSPKTRRQSSTTHACEECRRRKIRCDGKQPCSHCEWYKHPKLCKYSQKQPRVVPSQKRLDELSSSLRQFQKIIEQLFPNAPDIDKLGQMPRGELVDLILSASSSVSTHTSSASTSPATNANYGLTRVRSEDKSADLEAIEQEPISDTSWNESNLEPDAVQNISDDVNALSMSVGRQSSYTGVSSIVAALRVMSKITTALETIVVSTPNRSGEHARSISPNPRNRQTTPPKSIAAPGISEDTMIDAYFSSVHPLIPMIDEFRFRRVWHSGERHDASWLALLNCVFAMGTIAASSAEDNSHLTFYDRAREYLNLETFGDGTIEALQALGLLGGYYLHYENRPNMAAGIMGAALRMACALGLHREYADESGDQQQDDPSRQTHATLLIPREVRRRTWWSLFCLDTLAGTTTGRPSLGRISSGVTVQPPSSTATSPASASTMSEEDVCVMILCAEIGFCKIATRVQDRLAEQPLLPIDEISKFDIELKVWWAGLPAVMKWPNECPQRARVPRAIVSWWYNNLRILIHRPMLLNNALRSSLENRGNIEPTISEDEKRVVEACRNIAGEAIKSIQRQWVPNQMSGWNATWLLFQASMVPLVTLFAEYNRGNWNAIEIAQRQVEAVLEQLEKMERWSLTAKRSRDAVKRIYDRHKSLFDAAKDALEDERDLEVKHESGQISERSSSKLVAQPQRQTSLNQSGNNKFFGNHGAHIGRQHIFDLQSRPPPHSIGASQFAHHQQYSQISHHHTAFASAQQQPVNVTPTDSQSQMTSMYGHQHSPGHMLPQQGGLAVHMGMHAGGHADGMMIDATGALGGGPGFMNEDELNAFWNQVMWGEGDMPLVMETAGYEESDEMGYGNDGYTNG